MTEVIMGIIPDTNYYTFTTDRGNTYKLSLTTSALTSGEDSLLKEIMDKRYITKSMLILIGKQNQNQKLLDRHHKEVENRIRSRKANYYLRKKNNK